MNDITQLLIALGVVLNALVAIFGAVQSVRNGQKSAKISMDMKELAVNTNSIRDALVLKTDKAARAEGTAAGLAQGRAEGVEPVKVDIVKLPDSLGSAEGRKS